MPNRHPAPLDLPRLVMRPAFGLGLLVLLAAALLGLLRANHNIEDEVDAAMALASVMGRLGTLQQAEDRQAITALRETLSTEGLRHLELHILDARGRALLRPLPPQAAEEGLLAPLYDRHRELFTPPDRRRVSWQVARPGGDWWTISLSPSREAERIEAINNLLAALALLLAGIGGLLGLMTWSVRRAFRPLAGLLDAIARLEQQDAAAVRNLPPMPIRELEAIAAALRLLVDGLDRAEAGRRLLSQKVLTLQEDERSHLARELHDEFGQRLTALRLDAAWLGRRLADQPEPLAVARGMAERCAELQQDIRGLLGRLRPLGPALADGGGDAAWLPLARLLQLLEGLRSAWAPAEHGPADRTPQLTPPVTPRVTLQLAHRRATPADSTGPLPPALAEALLLPRELVLAVYRLSQEALTNAARHAEAQEVRLGLVLREDAQGRWLDWSVVDDGLGLADPAAATQRGNGLAGMQERVWALGGRWRFGPAGPPPRPGLALQATLPVPTSAPAPDPDLAPDLARTGPA